jgi:glyoxylase-like metal-dependent hydrolase (beta-lactamase superfamily II)
MMAEREFVQQIGEIYRLKVPFESLYTSVFLIKADGVNVLVDCATYDSDVDSYIVPALAKMGLVLTDIEYLVLTHYHGDHAGGKGRILQLNPNIKIVENEQVKLPNGLTMYALKGHTLDCIGVFDERTNTLISGDGLQGAGIDRFRCSLQSKDEYIKTIVKIQQNKSIKNVLFSHAYEPWHKDCALGREEVEQCLQDCLQYVK